MKILLFIVAFVQFGTAVNAQSLSNIRLLYRDATKSEEEAKAFYRQVKDISQSDKPVLVAYKGAGLMLLARYTKLSERRAKVKEAVNWIEKSVQREPDNPEIRLIRLSVQENLPKILRYNQHINEDRKFVKEALPKLTDEELKNMINGYFSEFST